MDTKEILLNWRKAQDAGCFLPCPRCGNLTMDREDAGRNALSRRADVYICDKCGMEEALEDVSYSQKADVEFFKKPLDEWFAVMTVFGKGVAEGSIEGGFFVNSHIRFKLETEDIDDIMVSALECGINYWCCKAEIVEEEYLGEFASEQIARGGSLRLYDAEEDEQYILTLEKFLSGMAQLVSKGYDEYHSVSGGKVDTCEIDAEIADRIVQLALFDDIIFG